MKLYSTKTAANILHVHTNWISRTAARYDIPFTKIHRRRYFTEHALQLLKSKRGVDKKRGALNRIEESTMAG